MEEYNFPSSEEIPESFKLSGLSSNKGNGFHFKSVEYSINDIVEKINNIDSLHENEIKDIILKQHSTILNYDLFLKSYTTRTYAQKLFTNKNFLQLFICMSGLLQLNQEEVICINKLAYDYYILDDKDPEVSSLLMQISNQINNILVIRLSSKLNLNSAKALALIANSSFKIEKNIVRVNRYITKYYQELSVQDIVDIFCILFERFTNAFIYTMMIAKTPGLDHLEEKNFDNISAAILVILDSMNSRDISKILLDYAYTLNLKHITKVRFSLKTAYAFPRILNCINYVETNTGFKDIIIP